MSGRGPLRDALRKALATQGEWIHRGTWQQLVDSGQVDRVLNGKLDLQGLAAACLELQRGPAAPPLPRSEVIHEAKETRRRARALAQLLASTLSRDSRVVEFRRKHLGDRTPILADMPRWLVSQQGREGKPADQYLAVPLPAGERLDWFDKHDVAAFAEWLAGHAARIAADPASELPAGDPQGPLTLEYKTVQGRLKRLPIRGNGVLAELKRLVSGDGGVCELSGWPEAAAVAFVLCGQVPSTQAARVTLHRTLYPAADHLELLVSATLTQHNLVRLWQQLQGSTRTGYEKDMSAKTVALALFIHEHKDCGIGWQDLAERWNEAHPEWRFEVEDDELRMAFATQARMAWLRVTGAQWPDMRDERMRRYGSSFPRGYQPSRSQPGRRPSPAMAEKRQALAGFLDELKDKGLSWAQLRERWNELHPEWHYKTAAKPRVDECFSIDARKAWSLVTGRSWQESHDKRRSSLAEREKYHALAVFITAQQHDGLSWNETRERWNELHPEWRFCRGFWSGGRRWN